jgi:hypothetical protein
MRNGVRLAIAISCSFGILRELGERQGLAFFAYIGVGLINTGLPARWGKAIGNHSRLNGFHRVREAVETAVVVLAGLTPGWKPGVNEKRPPGECELSRLILEPLADLI